MRRPHWCCRPFSGRVPSKSPRSICMTTPNDAPDWRKLSQQELDRGLNNGEAVAGSGGIVPGWDRRSAELPDVPPAPLDLPDGARELDQIDFAITTVGAPTLLILLRGLFQ